MFDFYEEVDMALIGGLLKNPKDFRKVSSIIDPEYFLKPIYRSIFEAMQRASDKGQSLEIHTVYENLDENLKGSATAVQMVSALERCYEYGPMSLNLEFFAEELKKLYLQERKKEVVESIRQTAETGGDFSKDIQALNELEKDKPKEAKTYSEGTDQFLGHMEQLVALDGKLPGVTSGFKGLDSLIGGFQKQNLIIMAARPGMGKTAFALQLFRQAIKDGLVCVFYSLEMSMTQLMGRLISAETGIDVQKVQFANLSDDDWDTILASSKEAFKKDKSYFVEMIKSMEDIGKYARQIKSMRDGLDLIVVDYLQLIPPPKGLNNREREVSIMSGYLKTLSKALDVPVIALAQLNRSVESRENKRPHLGDLRDSGSIEQDADSVFFLYRDEYYNKESTQKGIMELICAKNRHGQTGSLTFEFVPSQMRFLEK